MAITIHTNLQKYERETEDASAMQGQMEVIFDRGHSKVGCDGMKLQK